MKKFSISETLFTIFTLIVLIAVTYFSIIYAFDLWNKEDKFIDLTNKGLSGTLLSMVNNLFYNILGSYKVASLILFGIGIYSFYIFIMSIIGQIENFKKK